MDGLVCVKSDVNWWKIINLSVCKMMLFNVKDYILKIKELMSLESWVERVELRESCFLLLVGVLFG